MTPSRLLLWVWCCTLYWAPLAWTSLLDPQAVAEEDGNGALLEDEMDNQENILTQVKSAAYFCSGPFIYISTKMLKEMFAETHLGTSRKYRRWTGGLCSASRTLIWGL